MNWRIKASLQKVLSASTLGDKLNHLTVTFGKKYHQNVFLYQSHECLRKFSCCPPSVNRDVALEIGTGYSILSSVVLSLLGFGKVVTVDITRDLRFSTFKKQIKHIDDPDFLKSISSKSIYTEQELLNKVSAIKKASSFEALFDCLNIIYIAPYTFDDIEKVSSKFDYICSQVVLEHIHPDILEELFKRTKRWLKNGYAVHTINFIDHFANPGLFQDKGISEFNFLRFSDKYWSFWAGNSIAYTNRLSHIYYLELCKKLNLEIVDFIGENYRERVELDLNSIHRDVLQKYVTEFSMEELTKFQRGTLILKGSK
jgi:SAM-dependent methyltransferase